MIEIDGSMGEGGGQILRSSLALSLVTQKPFRIFHIRKGRKRPGLMRQHLTSLQAAARVGGAKVEGDVIGSEEVTFHPSGIHAGHYEFSVGTAGSTMLVLQTVLPPLMIAEGESTLILRGGTHNPYAPPFHFVVETFLPLLEKMGVHVEADLKSYGFYPAGGGKCEIRIQPSQNLAPLEILEREGKCQVHAVSVIANLSSQIAKRELKTVQGYLGLNKKQIEIRAVESQGPGNLVFIEIESDTVKEVVTAFGERQVPAEAVAKRAAREAKQYLESEVPVGLHLADQLLIPLAMAGGGAYRTLAPTEHTRTNIEVVRRFLDVGIRMEKERENAYRIEIGR